MKMMYPHKNRPFGRTGARMRAEHGFFLFAVLLVLALAGVVPSTANASSGDAVYTLHLTHYIRFSVNGQGRNIQAQETLRLTEADFSDGVCDLTRYAADVPQLTVTEAKPLSIDAFGAKRECGARIVYAVSDGWRVVPASTQQGIVLRDVFNGALTDYSFAPANIVKVNVTYLYSPTGGLAGVSAADPEVMEGLPVENNGGGTYSFTFSIPSLDGFRVVLNSAPLNAYLVTPPKPGASLEEIKQQFENGDFSVNITKDVYYSGTGTTNPKYQNIYSDAYNAAWNSARILTQTGEQGYKIEAVCGNHSSGGTAEDHGANALENPQLKVTLTKDQLEQAKQHGLNVTVYYRRNATWYTVKHWVPDILASLIADDITGKPTRTENGTTYVCIDTDTLQGRVGGLTNASAKTENGYALLTALPFSQQLVKNSTDNGGTTLDIFYAAATSYRVIFDTDYTYIPRQQVNLNEYVIFDGMSVPTRQGYAFAGWQYEKKKDGDYETVKKDSKGQYQLQITPDLISKEAKLNDTSGVLSLHLYPIWTPAKTNITVILWTEDLTGVDDVQATAEGGNPAYYTQKYQDYGSAPTTHHAVTGQNNANYSNVSSFTMEVWTDSSLLNADSKTLRNDIQAEVTKHFQSNAKDTAAAVDASAFYKQDLFEILHENNGQMDYSTTTANADGNTMVYVYFTRNIYTLKFHYYGRANNNDYSIAINTNGFSYAGAAEVVQKGELNFAYSGKIWDSVNSAERQNAFTQSDATQPSDMPVPQTITIKAKYGADLRPVWPAAQKGEATANCDMVSWATTDGKYRDDAVNGTNHSGEPTIMGLYATMDNEIIAKPAEPNTVHHLVAYWWWSNKLSYYRYNHCFEVPGVDLTAEGVLTHTLYNDANDPSNPRNVLYLVPTNNAAITKYGFNDLLKVSYQGGKITYDDPNGTYYAVRQFDGTCYALGRQVNAVSSNYIMAQNPSPRQHMERVQVKNSIDNINDNCAADHTTERADTDGRVWSDNDVPLGAADDPYDLYFYYKRERYTIQYMVTNTRDDALPIEYELGHLELPFGTHITSENYAFKLDQEHNNHNLAYQWTWPTGVNARPVCPDRATEGTANWRFKGWGLGPAGVNMQWKASDSADPAVPQGQAQDDFYLDRNLLLYAIWETPTYTVTFHLNGGAVSGKDNTLVVSVPANMRFTASGATIPRPVRSGFKMVGWYVSDEQGNYSTDASGKPINPFDFDTTIIKDWDVAAAWETDYTKLYSYTVYYVTQALNAGDPVQYTVQIANDAIVDDDSGTTYYVLAKDVYHDQAYAPNISLNLMAKPQSGYIPVATNKTLTLVDTGTNYAVIFYYRPQTESSHTVQFVLAGTESTLSPTIIHTMSVNADQTVVTPDANVVTELSKNLGYRLVNRNSSGHYEIVKDYGNLTWIDGANQTQPLATLAGNNIPATVTYLVEPIPYTIAYENANGSPNEAGAALSALTAPNGTPVNTAVGLRQNPTEYKTTDAFTLKNPSFVYSDGKVYQFSHWSLGKDTTVKNLPAGTTYTTLKVDPGTVGNLIFVANWKEMAAHDLGNLTVSKTVSGNSADTQRAFSFTVRLSDNTLTGAFGEMNFTNGEATFTLKHGESITATGLPAGIQYVATENDYDGYVMTASGNTGAIVAGNTAVASFNNQLDANSPANPNHPNIPQTGDNSRLTLWLALLCVSMLAILTQLAPRRRGKGK